MKATLTFGDSISFEYLLGSVNKCSVLFHVTSGGCYYLCCIDEETEVPRVENSFLTLLRLRSQSCLHFLVGENRACALSTQPPHCSRLPKS